MEEKLRTTARFLKDVSLLSSWKDEDIEQLFSDIRFFLLGTNQANVPDDCKFDQVMRVLAQTPGAVRYIRLLDRVAPSLKYQEGFDPQERNIPLCCSFKNLDNARALIDADPETIQWSSTNATPLLHAMLASYDAFRLLMDRGCDEHLASMHVRHPLFVAMTKQLDKRIVADILRAKPSLSIETMQISPPINVYAWMTRHGTTEDVLALHGLDCMGFEPYEYSSEPLAAAITVQNEELVDFFLQFVTEMTTRIHPCVKFHGKTFLHLAAKTKNSRILHAVWAVEHLRKPLFNRRYSDIRSPFTVAAKYEFNEACLLFLNSGWIPAETDIFDVLKIPNAGDIIECMVQLDSSNLDRSAGKFGHTVFIKCALLRRFENADRLVSLGATIEPLMVEATGALISPLEVAVQGDNAEALAYFIQKGISPSNNEKAKNLLRTAIFRQVPLIVHFLYDAGIGWCTTDGDSYDLITRSNHRHTSPLALYAAIQRGYRLSEPPVQFTCDSHGRSEINSLAKGVFAYLGATNIFSEDEIVDVRYECFFSVSLVHRLLWSITEHRLSCPFFPLKTLTQRRIQ